MADEAAGAEVTRVHRTATTVPEVHAPTYMTSIVKPISSTEPGVGTMSPKPTVTSVTIAQ